MNPQAKLESLFRYNCLDKGKENNYKYPDSDYNQAYQMNALPLFPDFLITEKGISFSSANKGPNPFFQQIVPAGIRI